jgi:peptidoglycan hydrolase-like protein with peptidoglycan-binding domain
MIVLTRSLKYTLPMIRGRDVITVQRRLRALGFSDVGQPDGLYGPATERAVRAFQRTRGLQIDGVVGPITFHHLFESAERSETVSESLLTHLQRLTKSHRRFPESATWALTQDGLSVDGAAPEITAGEPTTVRRVWNEFGPSIRRWSNDLGVPPELIIATICTESGGNSSARREESGFTSDTQTPHRVSLGLMQTLISTARETLKLAAIDSAWLLEPDNAIRAGTAYIALQSPHTLFDPPVVACAYNAGGVYHDDSVNNRWRMRQFPLGTSHHADRFVQWFNDCFRAFASSPPASGETGIPDLSMYRLVRRLSGRNVSA